MIRICDQPIVRILTMGFGFLLVYSSLDKIAHPIVFAEMIENYQVVGKNLALWIAVCLPATELILGLLLILGFWTVSSLLMNAGLMTVFLILVSQAWIRGLDIECGCYGGEGSTIGPFKVLENLVLAGLSIWLWIRVRGCKMRLEKAS